MKTLINIFLFLPILTSLSFPQHNDSNKGYFNDSLKINSGNNFLSEIQIKFDEFELHREFNNLKRNISIEGDPQTIWLRTSLAISNLESSSQNFSPHFLWQLEKKYYEDSKFNPIKYVLGMAQAGAVGCLAYKHIKKYGFFK